MKKLFKWLSILIIMITSFFLVYEMIVIVASNIPQLAKVSYTAEEKFLLQEYVTQEFIKMSDVKISKEEIKFEIKQIVNPKFYREYECDIDRSKTLLITRKILIQKDLESYIYAYTLMHEYIHLDKMIANERLTDYLTIKFLHESDNLFLQKTAYYVTYLKINYDKGNEYDCTDRLIQYFLRDF